METAQVSQGSVLGWTEKKKKEKYDLEFLWAIKNSSSRGTLNSNWT